MRIDRTAPSIAPLIFLLSFPIWNRFVIHDKPPTKIATRTEPLSSLSKSRKLYLFASLAFLAAVTSAARAQGHESTGAAATVERMASNEHNALLHEPKLSYISVETSDRTSGHEWTERIIEVPQGRLRRLLLEDGRPLTADRARIEDQRLRSIASDPKAFIERERARKSDEQRAEQMFDLLPRAFLFREDGEEQGWDKIDYWPNPAYEPRNYEERILHEMSGTILIDSPTLRLRMLQGRLANDVSLGFGLLATIRSGSSFGITRSPVLPDQWKATSLNVRMNGYILLFKTLNRNQTFVHRDFKPIPANLTIKQAVTLLLQ